MNFRDFTLNEQAEMVLAARIQLILSMPPGLLDHEDTLVFNLQMMLVALTLIDDETGELRDVGLVIRDNCDDTPRVVEFITRWRDMFATKLPTQVVPVYREAVRCMLAELGWSVEPVEWINAS